MALPPEQLQRCVEQALSRVHKARCLLKGGPADVLYSVVTDLAQRNAVSEAVHRALDARHAVLLQRAGALREPEALQALWRQVQGGPDVAGTLWALLTHPLGEGLQQGLLYDARCWVFTLARQGVNESARDTRAAQELAALRAEKARLQLRLQAVQAELAQQRQTAAEDLARLRGELAAAREAAAVVPLAAAAAAVKPAVLPLPARAPAAACLHTPVATPAQRTVVPMPMARAPAAPPAAAPAPPVPLHGQRVLCVGGMPGATASYRRIVESAGARFAFHDGGIEHGVQRLDQQLGAADLVVCQAGCVNHEAYRRVKGHCRRLDKPCLFVERPSLSHFARTLGVAA
jgi:hypothetical protein